MLQYVFSLFNDIMQSVYTVFSSGYKQKIIPAIETAWISMDPQ